jgi:hypothetical protein
VRRVRLIHWNAGEAEERATALRKSGFKVATDRFEPFPEAFRRAKSDPPDAFVIDLSRLPSAGRDVALALREARSTRFVPIVFVGGDDAKVEGVKRLLPDATYTTWPRMRSALKAALAMPVVDPVVPRSRLDGYSGTPLPKKLGVKDGMTVALVGAPERFEDLLPGVDADIRRGARGRSDLALLFVRSRAELLKRLETVAGRAQGEIWVCWPKKASGVVTDIGESFVRETGLARGLVDYKIAAIDATWSGLRFTRRQR